MLVVNCCYFCGGNTRVHIECKGPHYTAQVRCIICDAMGPLVIITDTPPIDPNEGAITLWNSMIHNPLKKQLAELEAYITYLTGNTDG